MRKVRVIEKIITDDKGIKSCQFKYVYTPTKFAKMFDFPKEFEFLGLCPRLLMRFLQERVGKSTIVYNCSVSQIEFLSFSNQSYTPNTINKAYAELVKLDLLISLKRGYYAVNPIYYYKGSQADREKILKKILEFKNNVISFEELIK